MTSERLQSENPELYNTIFNRGVDQERKRISGWINSDIQNKWQLRDGILSGEPVETHGRAELQDFYGPVDAKLNPLNFESVKKDEPKKTNKENNDFYAQQELNDFYAEVDKQIKK